MLFYILRDYYPMLNSYFYKLTIISFQLSHLHFKSINYTSVHLYFILLHGIKLHIYVSPQSHCLSSATASAFNILFGDSICSMILYTISVYWMSQRNVVFTIF